MFYSCTYVLQTASYAVNKNSKNFNNFTQEDQGSKRSLTSIMSWLKCQGYDSDCLWRDIVDLVIKSIVAIQPKLEHAYNRFFGSKQNRIAGDACFEILGFDIMIDDQVGMTLTSHTHFQTKQLTKFCF